MGGITSLSLRGGEDESSAVSSDEDSSKSPEAQPGKLSGADLGGAVCADDDSSKSSEAQPGKWSAADAGGALDDWREVQDAINDARKELKVTVLTPLMPEELQGWLWSCTELNRLVISGGALTEIPADIAKLTQLTTLIVADNALESLPEELEELVELRVLEAGGNKLTALPDSLGSSCPALEVPPTPESHGPSPLSTHR